MNITEFLHFQVRKTSWFAHHRVERHQEDAVQWPRDHTYEEWMEIWREWEANGCPSPKGKTQHHKEITRDPER